MGVIHIRNKKTGKLSEIADMNFIPGPYREDWEPYTPEPVVIPEVLKERKLRSKKESDE